MKIIVFALLVVFAASFHVRSEQHDYWYTAAKNTASTGVPFADVAWNYCDVKCVNFEKKKAGFDFFVINFKDAVYKPNFTACYAKNVATGEVTLWNKVI